METELKERLIQVSELTALGLYGPAHCTCLDEFPVAGAHSVFCRFCECVEDWERLHPLAVVVD